MAKIRLGFSEPVKISYDLGDGLLGYGVTMQIEIYDITFHCVDKQSADNLVSVMSHSINKIDID